MLSIPTMLLQSFLTVHSHIFQWLMEEYMMLKKDWGILIGKQASQAQRDEVVAFVQKWTVKMK